MMYIWLKGVTQIVEDGTTLPGHGVILSVDQYNWSKLPENKNASINEILNMELDPLTNEELLAQAKTNKLEDLNDWLIAQVSSGFEDPVLKLDDNVTPLVRITSDDQLEDAAFDMVLDLLESADNDPRGTTVLYHVDGRPVEYTANEARKANKRYGRFLRPIKLEKKRVQYEVGKATTVEEVEAITVGS